MKGGSTPHRLAAAALVASAALVWTADSTAANLNGFLRDKGRADAALSYTHEEYDQFWVGEERVEDPGLGEVTTRSLSIWLGYGLTDRFTLFADIPFINAEGDGLAGFEETDWQDLTLLLAGRIFSLGDTVRSDLIGAAGVRLDLFDYEPDQPVDVGDGTNDWLFRIVYQLGYRGFYFSQQVGFDLRNHDAPDGLPFYTEAGQTWGPVTASCFYSRYIANGGSDIGPAPFTFPSNAEEYERFGAKVYGRVTDQLGLSGAYFTTASGRNTGDSSGFSGGVVVSF